MSRKLPDVAPLISEDLVLAAKSIIRSGQPLPPELRDLLTPGRWLGSSPPAEPEPPPRPPTARLVAEGDSWFDYPVGLSIVDYLMAEHGYQIDNLAQYGDSLENIAFGTNTDRDYNWLGTRLDALGTLVRQVKPKAVLLSAGGNDVAGIELASFLNHADSGLPPLREGYLRETIQGHIRAGFLRIANTVWAASPNTPLVVHGYGYAIPDGRPVVNLLGLRLIGPWLKPAFGRKNIRAEARRDIVRVIIDEFNAMLAQLESDYPGRVRYIDLRPHIRISDWVNELHLSNSANRRIAETFHTVLAEMGVPS